GDPFRVAHAGGKGQQYARHRYDQGKDQQKSARCGPHVQNRGWMRHQSSVGSLPPPTGACACSVVEPVVSNSRSNSATAKAVAEKATTTPVMTNACGTGSLPNPTTAPLRATAPKTRNTPLPSKLKAMIFRSGWGLVISP